MEEVCWRFLERKWVEKGLLGCSKWFLLLVECTRERGRFFARSEDVFFHLVPTGLFLVSTGLVSWFLLGFLGCTSVLSMAGTWAWV